MSIDFGRSPVTGLKISDVESLQAALDAKSSTSHTHDYSAVYAPLSHTHSIANITNLQTTLDGKASTSHNHDAAYAAIGHTHAAQDLSGYQLKSEKNALNGYAGLDANTKISFAQIPVGNTASTVTVGNDSRLSDARTPTAHVHAISEVTNLQTALDGKAATSHNHDATYAAIAHTHTIANVTNLQTTLDGKASTVHTHAIGDVTNLQSSLDGKAASGHTHDYSAVYAPLNHNHDAAYATIGHNHDSAYVGLSGNQTVTGVKTINTGWIFNSAPQIAVGTLVNHPVRRDDARMTDARTPLPHIHPSTEVTGITKYAKPGDDLNAIIATLTAGDTLIVQGEFTTDMLVAVSGTNTKPITIRGEGAVISSSEGRTGTKYALTVTGSYIHIADMVFQEGNKAVVVDGAHHVRFDRCKGRFTKTEAWKVRNFSDYIFIIDCEAEGAGLGGTYGEGFYVGDASSNWSNPLVADSTGYVRIERCHAVRCNGDGVDIKEGAHHVVVKDFTVDFTKGNAPAQGASFGDSGIYSRGDTCQFINVQARGVPGDGLKLYDVTINSTIYGRGMEVFGGLVENAGGAGVASQSDDLKVYSNFAIAGTVTGGRTNVVGGGWTSQYDPTTFVEQTWTTPAAFYDPPNPQHGATHAIGGIDRITPAMIGASAEGHTHSAGAHTHVISDVTNLQATLDAKAAAIHAHSAADITSGKLDPARMPAVVQSIRSATGVSGNVNTAADNGAGNFINLVLTGNVVMTVPTNGADFQQLRVHATAQGAQRTFTFASGFVAAGNLPTGLGPYTIPRGSIMTAIVEYLGSRANASDVVTPVWGVLAVSVV